MVFDQETCTEYTHANRKFNITMSTVSHPAAQQTDFSHKPETTENNNHSAFAVGQSPFLNLIYNKHRTVSNLSSIILLIISSKKTTSPIPTPTMHDHAFLLCGELSAHGLIADPLCWDL